MRALVTGGGKRLGRAMALYLARRGYATLTVDFRGQGLADRALDDPLVGHVTDFDEYQLDMDAVIAFARAEALPEPWFMMFS